MAAHPPRPNRLRSAFTVLELMIALALLGGLLAVAWSILGSYRTAEQRGWQQAYRIQVVRAVRELLEEDAAHWQRRASSPSADFDAARPTAAVAGFAGDPQGFQVTMLPSVDPLPWLEQVTAPPPSDRVLTGAVTGAGGTDGTRQAAGGRAASAVRSPLDRVRVTYRLTPDAAAAGGEPSYLLQRSVTPLTAAFGTLAASPGGDDAPSSEEVLTVEALYRTEEAEAASTGVGEVIVIRHLMAARFRYSDGSAWQEEWDSGVQEGLPWAIELRFDHPEAKVPYDVTAPAASANGPLPSEPAASMEPTAEATAATRDVRIVVHVPGLGPSGASR